MAGAGERLGAGARRLKRAARVAQGMPRARRLIGAARRGPVHCEPVAYHALVRELARGCDSVIDIGAGMMQSLEFSRCRTRIGLEAHRPYLEHRTVRGPVPLNWDGRRLGELFVDDAVDLVTLMDVLEHLEPADAIATLRQCEAVAAKRVLLSTPRGFFDQDAHDVFAAGLGGEELQAHRSGWEVGQLTELGYRVVVVDRFHGAANAAFERAYGADAEPVDGLVAWKDVG